MQRAPFADFSGMVSVYAVHGLAQRIAPAALIDLAQEISARNMDDALRTIAAYAQDNLIYNAESRYQGISGLGIAASCEVYQATPRPHKFNKFGQAYRSDAKLFIHYSLLETLLEAAVEVKQIFAQPLLVCDVLRTVDGAYNAYLGAQQSDLDDNLLSTPGMSAHNKAMAFDVAIPSIDFGTCFDDTRMALNHRNYDRAGISVEAKKNRLTLEAIFLKSAFNNGMLLAPLREEWWDFRLPEDRLDLWRVIESAARVSGIEEVKLAAAAKIEAIRAALKDESLGDKHTRYLIAKERYAFKHYDAFLATWRQLFAGQQHQQKLHAAIGHIIPPLEEKIEFYHGNFNPLYDDELRACGKHLTNGAMQHSVM